MYFHQFDWSYLNTNSKLIFMNDIILHLSTGSPLDILEFQKLSSLLQNRLTAFPEKGKKPYFLWSQIYNQPLL